MTEEKKDTRFASLEAIPTHAPVVRGLRRSMSLFYIDRRRTLPAVLALVACSTGAVLVAPSLFESLPTSTAFQTEKPIPVQVVVPSTPSPVEVATKNEASPPEGPPLQTMEPANIDLALAEPSENEAPAFVAPPVLMPHSSAHQPPRKIIPVAEAMSLYDDRTTAEPPKVTGLDEDVRPFFAEGLASEEETLAFFKGATEVRHEVPVSVTAAHQGLLDEDLSPTIALPESVPLPVARPEATSGRVEFRIEQGAGVQSGFILYNKDDANLRRYFVVAKAYRGGAAVPWSFKDVADGKDVSTDKFAIEVSEKAFRGLSEEKKKFGKVVNEVLGATNDGKARIEWVIESNGNMLAAPEGRG